MPSELLIFSGRTNEPLVKRICAALNIEPGKARVAKHNDGEPDIQLLENVRGKDVFIVNSTQPPLENLGELLYLTDAAIRSSAGRVTLVIPYLGGNRQNQKDKPRVPITAKVYANWISASRANRLLIVDAHSEVTLGFFSDAMKVDHLYGSFVLKPSIEAMVTPPFIVASPDTGGTKRANAFAKILCQRLVILYKDRPLPGIVGDAKVIGDVAGMNVVLVDDMIDTGGTIISDAKAARAAGALDIIVCATHGLFSEDAISKIDESDITRVFVTDTIHHEPDALKTEKVPIEVVSIAGFLAQAIQKIHNEESLSPLILQPNADV